MQPGPGGAQCALHPGVSANFVCGRCGNFMCASCSVNGSETQCPTCRQLNPVGFPYDANADLGALWSHATDGFQREVVMCLIAVVIYLAITFAGALVSNVIVKIIEALIGLEIDAANPFKSLRNFGVNIGISQVVGQLVNLVTQGIALVGLYRVFMDVLVGKKADLARMFSQLELLPKYIVMHLILFVTVTLPTFIFFGIVSAVGLRIVNIDWEKLSSFRFEKLMKPEFIGLLFGSSVIYAVLSRRSVARGTWGTGSGCACSAIRSSRACSTWPARCAAASA